MDKPSYSVALLDVDGTLIDSNDAHADSWVEAFRAEGIPVRFEDVRALIGMGGDRLMPKVSGIEEESEQGKRISERRKKLFLEAYLPKLRAFPGTRDFLLRLKAEGYKLAVASSSGKDALDALLKKAGVADLLTQRTSKDDADASKPAPDIIQAALESVGAAPAEAVMFGDTPYDIEAANKAGVATIAFLTGGWSVADMKGALAIYEGPLDCLKNFAASPLVRPEAASAHVRSGVVFPM